jgi:hypothetical protein
MKGQFAVRSFFVRTMTLGWNPFLLQVSQSSERNRIHIANRKVDCEPKRHGMIHASVGSDDAGTIRNTASNAVVRQVTTEHDHHA